MENKFIVITNCTARKKSGIPTVIFSPKETSIEKIANEWKTIVENQPTHLPAKSLYVGRSINEAKNVSDELNAPLYIISAGMGLIEANQKIPRYDLSASGKATELGKILRQHSATKSYWWRLLASENRLTNLVHQYPYANLFLALPSDYLELIKTDLSEISPNDLSRIKVFTSPAGQKRIADVSGVEVLPYDERLESIPGYNGTRSDFPQRALKHFIFRLKGHLLPTDIASKLVVSTLGASEYKCIPKRKRLEDSEICQLILQAWETYGGNSAKILRHLRDKELIACEQGRFARLRKHVAAEICKTVVVEEPES